MTLTCSFIPKAIGGVGEEPRIQSWCQTPFQTLILSEFGATYFSSLRLYLPI